MGEPVPLQSAKGKWVEDIVMGNVEDDVNVIEVIRTEKVPPMWTKNHSQQSSKATYSDSTRTSGDFNIKIQI